MEELSESILDLAVNSLLAGASVIEINVCVRPKSDRINIVVRDNGCGIARENLKKVTAPYFSTREGNRGMGLTLFAGLCKQCGGGIKIRSKTGRTHGTTVRGRLRGSHDNCPPLGDMGGTIIAIMSADRSVPNNPAVKGKPNQSNSNQSGLNQSNSSQGNRGSSSQSRLNQGKPNQNSLGIRCILRYQCGKSKFLLDTEDAKLVRNMSLTDTLIYFREMINENIENINGGFLDL